MLQVWCVQIRLVAWSLDRPVIYIPFQREKSGPASNSHINGDGVSGGE